MPKRNFTRELLAKRANGFHIVVSLSPHTGVPAEYKPRSLRDPEPWVAGLAYRFNGRECHAVKSEHVSRFECDLLLRNIDRLFNGAFQMGYDDHRFDLTTNQVINILARLTAENLVERHGDSYVIVSKGYARLADLAELAA